jgi:hypothetical protein
MRIHTEEQLRRIVNFTYRELEDGWTVLSCKCRYRGEPYEVQIKFRTCQGSAGVILEKEAVTALFNWLKRENYI